MAVFFLYNGRADAVEDDDLLVAKLFQALDDAANVDSSKAVGTGDDDDDLVDTFSRLLPQASSEESGLVMGENEVKSIPMKADKKLGHGEGGQVDPLVILESGDNISKATKDDVLEILSEEVLYSL